MNFIKNSKWFWCGKTPIKIIVANGSQEERELKTQELLDSGWEPVYTEHTPTESITICKYQHKEAS